MALWHVFVANVLLSFGIGLLLAGVFGSYFGKGRSRSVGFVLALVAALLLGLFAGLTWELVPGLTPAFDPDLVVQSIVAVTAAILGSLFALGTFVASVMRS